MPFEAFNRPFMFQVVHTESILYIQCQSVKSHDEWLRALREQVKALPSLNKNFHPGYYDGKWTCCSITDATLDGCSPAFDYQCVGPALLCRERESLGGWTRFGGGGTLGVVFLPPPFLFGPPGRPTFFSPASSHHAALHAFAAAPLDGRRPSGRESHQTLFRPRAAWSPAMDR